MGWWAIAAVAQQAAGSLFSSHMGMQQAQQLRRDAIERNRRELLQNAQLLGRTRAAAAASGAEFGSESIQKYLTDMAEELRRQSEWAMKSARRQADSLEFQSIFGGFAGLNTAFQNYGAANNWWRDEREKPKKEEQAEWGWDTKETEEAGNQ